jgi:hypothetical protein
MTTSTTTTRTIKSVKTSSIAASAYEAEGVANTLNVLEEASIWSYLISGTKLSIIAAWSAIASLIATIAYIKELSKKQD